MAYTSQFTGAQMDTAFRRVTNMVAGRATLTASATGGAAFLITHVESDLSNPVCIGTVRLPEDGLSGNVSIMLDYDTTTKNLAIRIIGSGLRAGYSYDVDYLLME